GVSNVSFGLSKAARPILNSVFLTHCLKAGLDAAIINPRDIVPANQIPPDARELAEDLVLARRDDALARLIAHFEAKGPAGTKAAVEEKVYDTPEARLHHLIVDRQQKALIETIDECLKTRSAVGVINDVLLGAMKEVGDRFGAGELILPFVLQSAEVMKKAVAYLEQFMEKNDSYSRGTVVLATVFGDVHDIGKNLVKTILSNKLYEGGVFYCRDAFEGLDAMTGLQSDQRPKLYEKLKREAHLHRTMIAAGAERASTAQLAAVTDVAPRSVSAPPKVAPPFWGTRIVPPEDLALRDIFDHLDLIELYKLQWGVRVKSRDQYQKLIADEFAAKRHELQEESILNGWLTPK